MPILPKNMMWLMRFRKADHQLFFDVFTIGPTEARRILDEHPPPDGLQDRPKVNNAIDEYTKAIVNGEWVGQNGMCLIFTGDGHRLNGQQRLHAIIKSGKPVPCCCVFGVDPGAFKTIDTHSRRAVSHLFTIRGSENASVLGTASQLVYRYATKTLDRKSVQYNGSISRLFQVVDANPELGRHISWASANSKKIDGFLTRGSAAALRYLTSTEEYDEASEEFWDRLIMGANLDADSPIHVCREKLNKLSREKLKTPTFVRMALASKAWNLFAERKTAARLSYNWWLDRKKENEPFPSLVGRPPEAVSIGADDEQRANEDAA